MESIARKVVPGHFSLVPTKWNIDGMAGRGTNYYCFGNGVFQSRKYGGKNNE